MEKDRKAKKIGKTSLFWQELKRRKVIKTGTMYAATAFILIDASANMFPRLGLPDWSVTFFIILLITGFPIALILSWIFDLTPKGVEKTEKLDEEEDVRSKERPALFTSSNLIIAVLLVIVCILLYPRVFHKDQFGKIRDDKGRISVAVMPFENLTGDSLNNIWQGGIQNLLISALSNSSELAVRRFETMNSILGQRQNINQASVSSSIALEVALDLDARTYILGKILKAGGQLRINAQLINADTEEIYKTYQVDCPSEAEIFNVSDSLGILIRNYLEIKKYSESIHSPGASSATCTNSPEAYGYYIGAYESMAKSDVRTTVGLLQKAIEADPDFVDAYVFLSLYLTTMQQYAQAEKVLDRVYAKRDQVPARQKLMLDFLYAYHHETPHEEIMYCRQIIELDELSIPFWFFLGYAHSKLEQYEEAVVAFDKVIEIHERWGTEIGFPHLYPLLGYALHKVGDHKREAKIWEQGLSVKTDNTYIIRQQAVCALSRGNESEATEYLAKYRTLREAEGSTEARIIHDIAYIYEHACLYEEALKFMRQAYSLDPEDPQVLEGLAWSLIDRDIDVEKGLEYITKAMEFDSTAYNIVETFGWGLYKMGRYDEALEALERALDLRNMYDHLIVTQIEATKKALS